MSLNFWRLDRSPTKIVLAAFLLLALAAALALSARFSSSRQRELMAFERLRQLGHCDVHWQTIGPAWFQRLPGARYLPRRLVNIQLLGDKITDVELIFLQPFTGLRGLALINTSVTDAGLEHLSGLRQLRVLYLEGGSAAVGITDAGLVHLKGLTNLEELHIPGLDRITDSGILQLLHSLPNLKVGRDFHL